jgi:ribosomal protein S18 acetylase RimI-like enzyme
MQARQTVIVEAELDRAEHQRAVVELTAAYALDVMGNGAPLPPQVLEQLVPGLRAHPTTLVLLAYVGDAAVGIATCFLGFSTFAARSLVNVHDLAVLPEYRGQGIGRALLAAVERVARERGCVKVTLEVQENNRRARRVYEAAGFSQATYAESTGGALFYAKPLQRS